VIAIAVLLCVVACLVAMVGMVWRQYQAGDVIDTSEPDRPVRFGHEMAWLAVRTADTAAVVKGLGLVGHHAANWQTGVAAIYDPHFSDHSIFVSPPVAGWTLVAGLSLPQPLGPGFVDKCSPLLRGLSEEFGEAQYFNSYPPLDYFAWAQAVDGCICRGLAIGDAGPLWNIGRLTRSEKALGLKLFELRGVDQRSGDAGGALLLAPTESQVVNLAARWSVNPLDLEARTDLPRATGIVGASPRQWRSEAVRKRAA